MRTIPKAHRVAVIRRAAWGGGCHSPAFLSNGVFVCEPRNISGSPRLASDLSPRQPLVELGAGALRRREFRIGYNDHARLDGVEQRIADRKSSCRERG